MSIYRILFSPTGGTKRVLDIFANAFCSESALIDLADQSKDFSLFSFHPEDICMVAVPAYGGRVPAIAISRLQQMKGNKARAILLAVYGNRAYEDTLLELQDALTACGFTCVAAMAAVAEHSIMHQFAAGRPDAQDERELSDFAKRIQSKMDSEPILEPLSLPGNRPYRTYNGIPLKPQAQKSCIQCGRCAKACPVGAIPVDAPSKTNTELCISCMRCMSICPQKARSVNKALLSASVLKLKKACSGYKNNELFL